MRTPKYKSKIFAGISFIVWPVMAYIAVYQQIPLFAPLTLFSFSATIVAGFSILLLTVIREHYLRRYSNHSEYSRDTIDV